jgi:hypothetical protein
LKQLALAATWAILLALGAASAQAQTTTINFDNVVAPKVFSSTTHLGEAYASLGVHFAGPNPTGGGAILDSSTDLSGIRATSGNNLLTFAPFPYDAMSDGGIPWGPETITFDATMAVVSFNALDYRGPENTPQLLATAYNAVGGVADMQLFQPTANTWGHVSLASAGGIKSVVISEAGTGVWMGIDDLSFSTTPEPATLSLLALGAAALVRTRRHREKTAR